MVPAVVPIVVAFVRCIWQREPAAVHTLSYISLGSKLVSVWHLSVALPLVPLVATCLIDIDANMAQGTVHGSHVTSHFTSIPGSFSLAFVRGASFGTSCGDLSYWHYSMHSVMSVSASGTTSGSHRKSERALLPN